MTGWVLTYIIGGIVISVAVYVLVEYRYGRGSCPTRGAAIRAAIFGAIIGLPFVAVLLVCGIIGRPKWLARESRFGAWFQEWMDRPICGSDK